MIALLLTLGVFGFWWLVGLGSLTALRLETADLRIALSAPVLGSAVTVVPLFIFSRLGFGMEHVSPVVAGLLFGLSVIALLRRGARVPRQAVPVIVLCIVVVGFVGRPFFTFGFDWIGNANDDMANYVLSATHLVHHGLLGPIGAGVAHDRDFPSLLRGLHNAGSRPGSDITLAGLSAVVRRPPYDLFMPLILAFGALAVSATAALALQATRRASAAWAAALLFAFAPAAQYGVLQQLLPQVWGLGLAAVLLAWLCRSDLYGERRASLGELAVISVLAFALVLVYVELAATIGLAYVFYLAMLAVNKRPPMRALLRLWVPVGLVALIIGNSYLLTEIAYVRGQSGSGFQGDSQLHGLQTSLFGFSLVPQALAWVAGIGDEVSVSSAFGTQIAIAAAIVLLVCVIVAMLATARRRIAASSALWAYFLLGVVLGSRSSSFGLFKIYMYVQPFLAAAVGAWLALLRRPRVAVVAVALLVLALVGVRASVLNRYVSRSTNPIDLRHASNRDLLPAFRRAVATTSAPLVTVADNPVLAKLEASSMGNRPLHFLGKNTFALFNAASGWQTRSFDFDHAGKPMRDPFDVNLHVDTLLREGRCRLVAPSGSQLPLNRWTYPEGSRDLIVQRCSNARNLLVFTASNLGGGFYYHADLRHVAFYQLESDPLWPGRTFAGVGPYILFALLRPASGVRLELSMTTTVRQDGISVLPPASVKGDVTTLLPLVGRGSARVISSPIHPVTIDGIPYVLLDMGADGTQLSGPRKGLANLFGGGVLLDSRFLTGYLRDVSLVSARDYAHLRPPSSIEKFPADLQNRNLEYSGLYEDGWVAEDSYVMLASGPAAQLEVRADNVLDLEGQRLEVLVDGRRVFSRTTRPGALTVSVPVPASAARRRIELRWSRIAHLGSVDRRPAAAHLTYIGLHPRER